MDANNLRFWILTEAKDWQLIGDPPGLHYDNECCRLRLAQERTLPPLLNTPQEAEQEARSRLNLIPQACDNYDTRAYWDAQAWRIKAVGVLSQPIDILVPPPNQPPTDLVMGYDGVLYVAMSTGAIVLYDTKRRWQPFTLQAGNFQAWRLAADSSGGVWAIDRAKGQIALVQGLPRPPRLYTASDADSFIPCADNPNPPRLNLWTKALLPNDEEAIAIATSPTGQLALLSWLKDGQARIRCLTAIGEFTPAVNLVGVRYPYSLTWVASDRLAVLLTYLTTEAVVYSVPQLAQGLPEPASNIQPLGDLYPLRNHDGSPFLKGISLPPHYPTTTGSSQLYHLSLPSFANQGESLCKFPIDSGSTQTIWHRLYLEAVIPLHCGIQIYLAASDSEDINDIKHWYEHQFGELFVPGDGMTPRGAWVSSPSEIPYHPGLLECVPEKNYVGLFTILIQRANCRVRTLQGRYLWVKVVLSGDGRTTPEIAALRVYASRFSYLNQYLPEFYRESVFGGERDQLGKSTPADFLERFLDNFEGILTPLEDRIANAYLLTDPRTTPDDALEWLGSWIGVTFDPAYPVQRRRRMLQAAKELYPRRGTLVGLKMALDLATDNAVSGGEIIVLEDFRLRRTLATILGADFVNEDDPLLAGITISGNSYVGDTLILGDETRNEFLGLFTQDVPKNAQEEQAIAALYQDLAHRVTIFVHQEVTPQDLGLIRRIVELETPAHIEARVVTATYPFMVSVASLVGVDSYLAHKPQPQTVTVGQSQVGIRDLIQRPASLDPRLEGEINPKAFEVLPPPPTITSFSPSTGLVSITIKIRGTNLLTTSEVKFNSVATTFTIESNTLLSAIVPANATSGKISVTTSGGTVTSSTDFTVLPPPPTITNFSPGMGLVGTTITIIGTNLSTTYIVRFQEIVVTVTANSNTQVTVKVPANATTGKISLTTFGGNVTSSTDFTVLPPPPTISSFSPNIGLASNTVTITGNNLSTTSEVKFNGVVASFTVNFDTEVTAVVPANATTGKISLTTTGGNVTSVSDFTVLPPPPTISSFSPSSSTVNNNVVITGNNLSTTSEVTFNGYVANITVNSDTEVTAVIPANATTGKISLTTTGGNVTSVSDFTVLPPPPTISSFLPSSSTVNNNVVIIGNNLSTTSEVRFNGVVANITAKTNTQVTAVVPANATTGKISLTTTGGTVLSSSNFIILYSLYGYGTSKGIGTSLL